MVPPFGGGNDAEPTLCDHASTDQHHSDANNARHGGLVVTRPRGVSWRCGAPKLVKIQQHGAVPVVREGLLNEAQIG